MTTTGKHARKLTRQERRDQLRDAKADRRLRVAEDVLIHWTTKNEATR